jgi:hypothetical protein
MTVMRIAATVILLGLVGVVAYRVARWALLRRMRGGKLQ